MAHPTTTVQVYLLGSFRVVIGGKQLDDGAWRRRKARQLFKYLLNRPRRRMLKEEAMEVFWPESEPEAASTNLRTSIYALRQALKPAGDDFIVEDRESYAVRPDAALWTDVDEFEALVAQATGADDPIPLLERAHALYGGEYLADDVYEDFASGHRERLKRAWSELQFTLGRLWEQRDEPDRAIGALERLARADPSDESAAHELIAVLGRSGRRAEALRAYQRLEQALRDDLGVQPSAPITRLHDQLATTLEPSQSGASQRLRTAMPVYPTRLIGREVDLTAVATSLRESHVRLVTLIGPGGVGKSRLSVAVAAELEPAFEHGVCFVDLAQVRDPALVEPTIARALGATEVASRSAREQVLARLHGRSVLLLLDNFEQVLDAAPNVGALLAACPTLKMLVTSRESLRVRWEHVYDLPPLPVPDPKHLARVADLARNPAVALLVERARAADGRFALSEHNARAIAELCSRLDGLPLALELAAARLRALSPELLAAHLGKRLEVLRGARDAPPRHQSLAAAIGWSYDLMSESEQVLFRRWAVFAGGCTMEAAEAVCNQGGDLNLVSEIGALVDRSLLRRDDTDPREPRFGMLQTVREFALERLQASAESEQIGRAHAAFYAAFAERMDAGLTGPNQAAFATQLQVEHDNVRAALRWCLDHKQTDLGMRLGSATGRFWLLRGYSNEGICCLEDLLALPTNEKNRAERAKVLIATTRLAAVRGDHMRAIDLVHQALADLQAVGDERGIARCMSIIASLAALRGEYKAAWRAYEEALRLHTEQLNQRGVGIALAGMGVLARHLGNLDQAESLSEQAQHMLHEVGDANGLARASLTIATVERARGNLPRALELARENLSRFQALGDREEIAECLEVLAGTIAVLGDLERAARLFGAAEALLETMGTTPPHTARYQYADDVAALRKRLGPAAADEAWAAGRALLPDVAIAEALDVVSLNQLPTATSVTG